MNYNNTQKSKNDQTDDEKNGGWFLPHPDQIGTPVPVEPEGAQFRSVAMVSSLPAMAPFARPGEGMFLDAPFIGQAPPLNLQTPGYCDNHAYQGGLCSFKEQQQPKVIPAAHHPAGSASSPWYLEDVETLPLYYPLEKTSKSFVLDGKYVSIITITENITNCLKTMSIQPKYMEDEASVALLTPENVEMYLCLWKTNDEKSIIVEIQRRCGCSITFHGYCGNILDAVDGNFVVPECNNNVNFESLKKAEDILAQEVSGTKISTNGATNKNNKDESINAIVIAQDLLQMTGNTDAQLLGMESLRILTDPRKTSINTAIMACRAVLFGDLGLDCGENTSQTMFNKIRDAILTNVLNDGLSDTENTMVSEKKMDICYDNDEDDFFFDGDSNLDGVSPNMKGVMAAVQLTSLTIIANALELLLNIGPGSETKSMQKESPNDIALRFLQETNEIATKNAFKRQDVLSSLIYELGHAKTKSHHAHLAARSLRYLCEASKTVTDTAIKIGMKEMCDEAHQVGKEMHANLEAETEMLRTIYRNNQ